jgi:hypothetical protein
MMMMPCDDDPSLFFSKFTLRLGEKWARGTVHLCRKKRKGFGFQPSEGRREGREEGKVLWVRRVGWEPMGGERRLAG